MDFFEIMLQQKLAGGGSDVKVDNLNVTENGTYTALPGHAFSPVNVSVPVGIFPSGTSDITSNGIYSVVDFASVNVSVPGIIPSGTSSITSNGIYDITSFASVDVNVSGGGGIMADDIAMRTISGVVSGSASTVKMYAFFRCYDITEANFPNATLIEMYGFGQCSNLATVNFPELISTGNYAFHTCALSSVYLPKLTSVGGSAFQGCKSLTTVNCPNLISVGSYAFASCSALKEISFPLATTIYGSAFYSCSSLSTVTFPKVSSVGTDAFRGCSNLMSVYFLASSVTTLSSGAFNYTPISNSTYTGTFGSIYVPASLIDAYKSATYWSVYSARITAYEGE